MTPYELGKAVGMGKSAGWIETLLGVKPKPKMETISIQPALKRTSFQGGAGLGSGPKLTSPTPTTGPKKPAYSPPAPK